MNARNHDASRQAPDWRAVKRGHAAPARRRNQYTPIVERPWFLALTWAIGLGLLWASAQGWTP